MHSNEGSAAHGQVIRGFMAKLPVPPTANNLFVNNKRGGRFTSNAYKKWQEEVVIDSDFLIPLAGRLKAKYTYVFPDNRKRDLGNFEKAISDILVKRGVIEDDSQIDHLELIRSTGEIAGVHILIETLPHDFKQTRNAEVP